MEYLLEKINKDRRESFLTIFRSGMICVIEKSHRSGRKCPTNDNSSSAHHESRSRFPRIRDRSEDRFSYAFSRFPRTESMLDFHASMSRVLSLSFGALKPTYAS